MKLTLGDTTVTIYITPGHTGGTLSVLVPVKDHGVPHMAMEWGGTALSGATSKEILQSYISNASRFMDITSGSGADVIIVNHTAYNDALTLLAQTKARKDRRAASVGCGQGGGPELSLRGAGTCEVLARHRQRPALNGVRHHLTSKLLQPGVHRLGQRSQRRTPSAPGFPRTIRREQQVPSTAGKLELNAAAQFAAIGDAGRIRPAQVWRRFRSLEAMRRAGSVDRRRDPRAPFLPQPAHVDHRIAHLLRPMQRQHEIRLRQQLRQRRLIKARAGDVQPLDVSLAQEARELIPRPIAKLRHGAQELRGAGFDPAPVRRHDQALADVGIAERNADVAPRPHAAVEDVVEVLWFYQTNTIPHLRSPAHSADALLKKLMRTVLLLGWLAASGLWGQQVLLRVRFAQLDPAAQAMLAQNLTATANQEIRMLRPGLDLVTFLEDLRARGGGVRILAEPTMLTGNAQSATLLAGSEVPIPVLHDGGVSIQYRDLGIRLTLQPAIHADGIRLSVKPSVSTLTSQGPSTVSLTIPEFGTRTSAVELTLVPGQSIVIDGLLDEAAGALLRHIPRNEILDAILKNGTTNTKLVVIVTPEVI